MINLSLVSPGLQLNILKTEKMLQFGAKNFQRTWHVIPALRKRLIPYGGNSFARTITSDRTVYNNSSFSSSFKLVGMTSLNKNY